MTCRSTLRLVSSADRGRLRLCGGGAVDGESVFDLARQNHGTHNPEVTQTTIIILRLNNVHTYSGRDLACTFCWHILATTLMGFDID